MDHNLPIRITYTKALALYPFMLISEDRDRLEPNELYCKDDVPVYEWYTDRVSPGYFRAMPHQGKEIHDDRK